MRIYLKKLFVIFCLTILICCNPSSSAENKKQEAKEGIQAAEKAFSQMAATKGISNAFVFYADSNATIRRKNDSLIHGLEGISRFYNDTFYKHVTLSWEPDFTDASFSGDLGYTYGKFTWQHTDSTGHQEIYHGIFHTV